MAKKKPDGSLVKAIDFSPNSTAENYQWQSTLVRNPFHPNPDRTISSRQTILIIDRCVPIYDRESGSRRLFEIIKIFTALNFKVIFAADDGYKNEPYTSILQSLQVEVLCFQLGCNIAIEEQIKRRLSSVELVWICRPELGQKYIPLVKQNNKIKVIYDTVDLHYLRLKREGQILKNSDNNWREMQAQELLMAAQADLTITVTATEQEILQKQSINNIEVIPNIHHFYQGNVSDFDSRAGVLFIGGYNHKPNVDAVKWLCNEIMPLVWQQQPELNVTLLGSNPTAEIQSLANNRITVTGYIKDVTPYFLSHKLFVSPLRYGAGMKGKIGQSLEYSLPVVSTAIGAEGMNLVAERDILEANNTRDFAAQILCLDRDARLWQKLSSNSVRTIAPYHPQRIQQKLLGIINNLLKIEY